MIDIKRQAPDKPEKGAWKSFTAFREASFSFSIAYRIAIFQNRKFTAGASISPIIGLRSNLKRRNGSSSGNMAGVKRARRLMHFGN
jgi:hypothetical protein